MTVLVLPCYTGFFFSSRSPGTTLQCSAQVSHFSGFSGCLLTTRSRVQAQLWQMGLVAPWHVASEDQGLHPSLLYWRVDSLPLSHQGSPLVFFTITILRNLKCYLIAVLICISLVIWDVEHLFIYLLTGCLLWKKYLFSSSHFLIKCLVFVTQLDEFFIGFGY